MTPVRHDCLRARITLTVRPDSTENEGSPLSDIAGYYTNDAGTALMLEQELVGTFNTIHGYDPSHHITAEDHLDTFDLSIKTCRGKVQEFTSWGRTKPRYLAAVRLKLAEGKFRNSLL